MVAARRGGLGLERGRDKELEEEKFQRTEPTTVPFPLPGPLSTTIREPPSCELVTDH